MSRPTTSEALLANDWPVSKVVACVRTKSKNDIVQFLRERHEERFFDPIQRLTSTGNKHGYGFAIMALCSLLIETIQCYQYGLPSTNARELNALGVPKAEWKSGREAFNEFFSNPTHQGLFPNVDGDSFYSNIRNGLLHQAQTKDGWKIKTGQPLLWNAKDKIIDRDKFSGALRKAFAAYLEELSKSDCAVEIWVNAIQKICWLVRISSATPCP